MNIKTEVNGSPFYFIVPADRFAGAQQCRRPLKLLQGKEAKCVAHQHGDTMVARPPLDVSLKTAEC